MGLTASQIRQDFNCFGGFGQQGYGYNIKDLHAEIGRILGVDRLKPLILLGAGNLGKAIASHMDFRKRGFELIGIFDTAPELKGRRIGEICIYGEEDLESFCTEHKPVAAVLCIPKEAAAKEADRLVSYGIQAFWNFSHYDLKIALKNVVVENVHLGDSLTILSYGLSSLDC